MPRRTAPPQALLLRVAVLALAGVVVALDRHAERRPAAQAPPAVPPRARRPFRRLAVTFALAALFCLGAALSAFGGDQTATLLEDEPSIETATAPPAEPPATPTDPVPAPEPAAALEPEPEPEHGHGAVPPPAPSAPSEPTRLDDDGVARTAVAPALPGPPATQGAPTSEDAAGERRSTAAQPGRSAGAPVLSPQSARPVGAALDGETTALGVDATVWLHRTFPDPTPPSRRLSPAFARHLATASRRAGVDWPLVLGVLRARGDIRSTPASHAELRALARALARHGARADAWGAVLAVAGDTAAADTALALAHYHRAVGVAALVRGLESRKRALATRLLRDRRVDVYPGGRDDIAAGRIDVRVLVLIAYLAEAHGGVTISSLQSGHRLFARPGVVSAHVYGLAVDVAALGGVSVLGNQAPGGLAERAVRNILLLPAELRPRQVISLLGLGGPSFPLADHGDHIHVGY